MKIIADLQLHSKYSRAVSQHMNIDEILHWAKRKGIGLVATGDWTHPLWLREIKSNLEELGNGFLRKRQSGSNEIDEFDTGDDPLFLLATEVSSIYSQGGKGRRIHTLIWAPTFGTVDKINAELLKRGANLLSDGRPIIGLSSIQVAELVLTIDSSCLIIPAHAWTPWFSLYGSESGFDSIDECFGPYAKYIYAIETGLSSDPAMNWRIQELDNRAILSFSDAHSGPKLGREATIFDLQELSFAAIRQAIVQNRISATIEFYPEEGKYHYTGHRNCGVKQTPRQTREQGATCRVCGRKLTVGVMHRVESLASRSEEEIERYREGIWLKSKKFPKRAPYTMMVPLQEIIAEVTGSLVSSQKVQNEYLKLTTNLGGEFMVLLKSSLEDISRLSGESVAEAIAKVRQGDIVVDPGFDGEFGKVKIQTRAHEDKKEIVTDQMSLFS